VRECPPSSEFVLIGGVHHKIKDQDSREDIDIPRISPRILGPSYTVVPVPQF